MRLLQIKVHALTRRVLLSELGHQEPFALPNHSLVFQAFNTQFRRLGAERNQFTASVSFLLDERIADNAERSLHRIATWLFAMHKQQMCWFVQGQTSTGKTTAKEAVKNWLDYYEVDEDEYSLDSAYKCWQRFGWNFQEKNPQFFGRLREKAARIPSEKTARRRARKTPPPGAVQEPEYAVARFLAAYSQTFRRVPKKLQTQARAYTYIVGCQLSVRQAAEKIGGGSSSTHYAMQAMCKRMQRNRTVATLMQEALALPIEA